MEGVEVGRRPNNNRRQSTLNRRFAGCLAVALLMSVGPSQGQGQENPLLTGIRLSETAFKHWKYGHRVDRRQVDCVIFVAAVVESLLQRELTKTEHDAIYINNIGGTKNLGRLIRVNDKSIRGIQTALVEMEKGEVVKPEDAKSGDFVQFWRLKKGKWSGHVAIIAEVIDRKAGTCALIFGAHQSLRKIGMANYEVHLNVPQTYIVRYKP